MFLMLSRLSSGGPFLKNVLYTLLFANKVLIGCVIQGSSQGLTVICLLGMKLEKYFGERHLTTPPLTLVNRFLKMLPATEKNSILFLIEAISARS